MSTPSPFSPQRRAVESDLSTRARIRDAALREFAKHGFKGASIRGIARAANVSPGLVQHYFTSKEELRRACDAYVMEFLHDIQQVIRQPGAQALETGAGWLQDMPPLVDYLVMSLHSDSESATQWFNAITDYYHDMLTRGEYGPPLDPSLDIRAIAATLAAMGLGLTAFYRTMREALGIQDDAEALVRLGRARLFLVSERIVGEEFRERVLRLLDTYEERAKARKAAPKTT